MQKKIYCISMPLLLTIIPLMKFLAKTLLLIFIIYIIVKSLVKIRKKVSVKNKEFWIIVLFIFFFISIILLPTINSPWYLLLNYALPFAILFIGTIIFIKLHLLKAKKSVLIILGIVILMFIALFLIKLLPQNQNINSSGGQDAYSVKPNYIGGCGDEINIF